MAESECLMGDSGAFLLQVSGVDPGQLVGQSILNLWDPSSDMPETCLARVEIDVDQLKDDVLERLTWGLLSWPEVGAIELYDTRAGRRVACVKRTGEASAAGSQDAYQWCDVWLLDESSVGTTDPQRADSAALRTFPPARGRRWWYGIFPRSLTGLDDDSLASRERLKYRLQRVFGRQATAFLSRRWRTIRSARKPPSEADCPISSLTTRALSTLVSKPASGRTVPDGVLMVLPRLDPGGAEKNAIDLAAAFTRRGTRVHILTTFQSANAWSERARSAGAQVWHLPAFLPAACWLRFVDVYVSCHAIAVMHISNSHWMYDNLASLKARHPDLRVVTQIHAEGERGDLDYPTLAARAGVHVDCHTVISRHLADHLVREHGVDERKIRIVRTGIDIWGEFSSLTSQRGEWRRGRGIGAYTQIVAFVGRFSDLKRPLVFLSMAELVLKSRPETRFVMKGGGPLLDDIERRLACSPSLRRAVIVEDAQSAVAPVMIDADLLVLTSAMEGVAYVSYEAMALGLVQVSADVGAQSELITPESGVLVPVGQGEEEGFSKAVCALLADEERRTRMSRHAIERIRRWPTVEDMAVAYMDVYKDLLGPGEASSERPE